MRIASATTSMQNASALLTLRAIEKKLPFLTHGDRLKIVQAATKVTPVAIHEFDQDKPLRRQIRLPYCTHSMVVDDCTKFNLPASAYLGIAVFCSAESLWKTDEHAGNYSLTEKKPISINAPCMAAIEECWDKKITGPNVHSDYAAIDVSFFVSACVHRLSKTLSGVNHLPKALLGY
jgi:hypothetical protein